MNRYFSVDCEFSGLDHTRYDLISFGMVEVIKKDNKFIVSNNTLYEELKPLHKQYNIESMKINGLNFSSLYKNGIEPIKACNDIIKYINQKPDDNIIFIGYCDVLDKIYIDQLFLYANIENPFHYETIEISSLAIGKLGLEWGYSESDLEKQLGMSPMDASKKHNALEDAIHQAHEFCNIINL